MNKLIYMSIFTIIIIFMLAANVYAYENNIFKMDIPSDYAEMSYSGRYICVKSEERSIAIYAHESAGLKKNISTMSQSEIEELIGKLVSDKDSTIIEQKKEKLGKSKAIKARVKSGDTYIDMYIVVSINTYY